MLVRFMGRDESYYDLKEGILRGHTILVAARDLNSARAYLTGASITVPSMNDSANGRIEYETGAQVFIRSLRDECCSCRGMRADRVFVGNHKNLNTRTLEILGACNNTSLTMVVYGSPF